MDVSRKNDVLEKVEGGRPTKRGGYETGPAKVKRTEAEKVLDEKEEALNAKDGEDILGTVS